MRTILIATFLAGSTAAIGTAGAGPLETFKPIEGGRNSIVTMTCDSCAAPVNPDAGKVAPLAQGTQRVELKDVDGQMMVYTTEAWLGGSPVTIVRKATELDIAKYATEPATNETAQAPKVRVIEPMVAGTAGAPQPEASIDRDATTGALTAAATAAFDATKLELRATMN